MFASILTWLGDVVQLGVYGLAVLVSLMIASWWGELAGIPPGRDKSGLGGFAMIYPFFAVRWLAFMPLLVLGANARLPGSWPWWLLLHGVLGVASVRLFERGITYVRADRVVPLWLGATGALLLPAPAFWLGTEAVAWACVGGPLPTSGALLVLHAWPFWQRRRELHRVRPEAPPPSEIVDTDRGR